jgi:hypothetical protein
MANIATDKTFDTNTFVLKKKEKRKIITPIAENKLDTVDTFEKIDLEDEHCLLDSR